MVFWKIVLGEGKGTDITSIIAHYVKSIQIRASTLPMPKTSTKTRTQTAYSSHRVSEGHAPLEATIDITSKNYIEDWFYMGQKIKIYMGYDRILAANSLVFSGEIIHFPDGEAQEMINYSVKAYGNEILLATTQRNRVFMGKPKAQIIREIISVYDFLTPVIDIEDTPTGAIIQGQYCPMQSAESDFEVLQKFARDWNCKMWFPLGGGTANKFYFVDAKKAVNYQLPYKLGYRTDKTECNVEKVSWSHTIPRAATQDSGDGGLGGFNEMGKVEDINKMKINEDWSKKGDRTWRANKVLLDMVKKDPSSLGYLGGVFLQDAWAGKTLEDLQKYYELVNANDPTKAHISPEDDDSGWEITVSLNEGNPKLFPPFKAHLYSGSINPKADTSYLPEYLFKYGQKNSYLGLNVNEIELTYDQGRLKQDLKCSIGMFV